MFGNFRESIRMVAFMNDRVFGVGWLWLVDGNSQGDTDISELLMAGKTLRLSKKRAMRIVTKCFIVYDRL